MDGGDATPGSPAGGRWSSVSSFQDSLSFCSEIEIDVELDRRGRQPQSELEEIPSWRWLPLSPMPRPPVGASHWRESEETEQALSSDPPGTDLAGVMRSMTTYGAGRGRQSYTYMQSITVRLKEWRLKRRAEEWMRHRQLPRDLSKRVRQFVQYEWLAIRGVDEESILLSLPTDLRRDIRRHLCLPLVRRVPFFSEMGDQFLDAICERLVSSLSTAVTCIVRKGDPVTEMLLISQGRVSITGFFNPIILGPGDFCGEELLTWAMLPESALYLPSSTMTVVALEEVEAFALRAEDLKFVANQFRRLHGEKLQHMLRYYSQQWRRWAACFIQAAWCRFKRRKMDVDLSMQELFSSSSDEQVTDGLGQDEEEHDSVSSNPSQPKQNIGVTILASNFAATTRRAQRTMAMDMPKLQKPHGPPLFC